MWYARKGELYMPRRGDNIRKRKDGRWEGRYKSNFTKKGKAKYNSVYGKTYGEVKRKLTEAIKNNCEDTHVEKNKTFGDLVILWQHNNSISLKGSTKLKYDYLINRHILPDLGKIKVKDITIPYLNDYAERKMKNGRINGKDGLSASYVRSIMIVISSVLKFAVDEQLCSPYKTKINKPSVQKAEVPVLSHDEQKKYEEYLIKNLNLSNMGILISLYCGLRIGEVCALEWENIDLDNMVIHIRTTVARVHNIDGNTTSKSVLVIDRPKTKASVRDIPIPSKLSNLLHTVKGCTTSKYVISDKSTFLSPRTFEYRYHKTLEECNIAPVNFHALRHTFATRCIEAGVDIKTLSEILGHSNVSITLDTYVHSSMEIKRMQLEKLCY